MNELPAKYMKLINRYKPVEVEGFTLYPVTGEHYEEYLIMAEAVGYMQQRLPIDLMSMPILSAFFRMDLQKVMDGEQPTGLYTGILISLILAMRLAGKDEDLTEVCGRFQAVTKPDDPMTLKALLYETEEQAFSITPAQYNSMRKIIAAQNGIEIRDVLENPELVDAEADLAEKGAMKLEPKVTDYIDAAVVLTGLDEDTIYQWPVLKLNRILEMHRRIIDYQVCGIAEGSGASWKGGNPVPHPFFAKKRESNALVGIDEWANGAGRQAMADAGETLNTDD